MTLLAPPEILAGTNNTSVCTEGLLKLNGDLYWRIPNRKIFNHYIRS